MAKRLFRLFAFVLLALTIPVQGMAAVMAGQCMALGHHQEEAGGHDDGHAVTEGHDHASHSHSDEGSGTPANEDGGHCGPCVACCASASIAASIASVSPCAPHTAVAQVPYPFLAGIQPDELDRPPLVL